MGRKVYKIPKDTTIYKDKYPKLIIRRQDISTWNKTAALLYGSTDYQRAYKIYLSELKWFNRPYNLKRIAGRVKRLYAQALLIDNTLLSGIKPINISNVGYVLGTPTLLRAYIKFHARGTIALTKLYRLLKYERTHKDRESIIKLLISFIVRGPNFGIRKADGTIPE